MRTEYKQGDFHNTTIPEIDEKETPKKKIIDKITKLLALSESTTHEKEKETATNLAINLLAKHNISLSQKEVNEQPYTTIKNYFKTNPRVFERQLHNIIAKFTGVFLFRHTEHTPKKVTIFNYVGTPANLRAFQYMLILVLQQRESAYIAWMTSTDFKENSDKHGWKNGFTVGVMSKCIDLIDLMKQKVEERGLQVVSEDQGAKMYIENNMNLTTKKNPISRINSAGYKAGQSVSLNKGVTSQTKVLRIEG